MKYVTLTQDEVTSINNLLDDIFQGRETIHVDDFLLEAAIYGHRLPERIRRTLYHMKLCEAFDAVVIRNNPVDDERIGNTPTQLPDDVSASRAGREDVLHMLYASLLGEPIAWTTQQFGRVLNDIVPIKENEDKIIGSGSIRLFDLHTEDAFHPYAADFLGLMCLRNPYAAPTILASLQDVSLDPHVFEVLFQPRFILGVNAAHAEARASTGIPVLFGHPSSPYMRLNLNRQSAVPGDTEAEAALDSLAGQLTEHIQDVALKPGDILYFDNFRVAHGRGPYSPRYDGTDRWLKRLTISSYLRKSRNLRPRPDSRLIETRTSA